MGVKKHLKKPDGYTTWNEVYLEGGEDLLRQYSDAVHDPKRGVGESLEEAFLFRLATCAQQVFQSERELLLVMNRLPENRRKDLVYNKHCTAQIIETIWIGNYHNAIGEPRPDAIPYLAYMCHCEVALDIYCRRPDLRRVMSKSLISLFEWALKERGMFAAGANTGKTSLEEGCFGNILIQ